ncbi:MAG: energy-coupling factor transporter transmembrane protein EcfT [Actinobacteria bacterium]|nr:energy-coupling factor transporter transmembrane protein EcfT [Actinomycetota bacterium]
MTLHPMTLHPVAWWLWALAAASVAARTTNVVLLVLVAVAVGRVVALRRPASGAPAGFGMFLRLALTVVAIRVVLQALFVGSTGATVMFSVPQVPLPAWMAGVSLGGPVTAEAALAAVGDGGRLAVVLLCVGAANTLATPARLLRYLPRGLQAFGLATSVALTAAPALAVAFTRIRKARRLRGLPVGGVRGAVTIVVPVLEEALDRALVTASALESRGFGRRGEMSRGARALSGAALLSGPVLVVAGAYLLLGSRSVPAAVVAGGAGLVAAGLGVGGLGLRLAGSGLVSTRYRPDPWGAPEWVAVAAGAAAAALAGFALPARVAHPDPWSLQPPVLDPAAVLAVALLVVPSLPAFPNWGFPFAGFRFRGFRFKTFRGPAVALRDRP